MIKLGIECENLEDPKSRWGVGAVTLNLLKEYSKDPELQKKFKLYLYFKKKIPDDIVLKNPLFVKRIVGVPSFNIFYHIAMPLRAMMDRLDWMFFPAYMLPPLYTARSIVMLTNDVHYEYTSGDLPFRYKLAYRLFTNWAAVRANKILAISEASKKEVARLYGIDLERIFVSHLGVKTDMIQDSILSINESGSYILYVGQMFPRRHAKETILAFKNIAAEFPNLKLIMVGKDKYSPSVIDESVKDTNLELGSERIVHYDFLEKKEDIDKLYAAARLLIYVSDHEAFGLPPVEAASYGVPVVVNDSELSHELFNDAAFFSKGGSAEKIAEAIRLGLTDETKRNYCVGKYKMIIPVLSWKNFAQRFFSALG